jgi:hypothetical protein
MTARRIRTLLASALVLGAVTLGSPSASPVGADPSDVELEINTFSPFYREDLCLYRIVYGNYGSTPYAAIRGYSTYCIGMTVWAKTVDNNGTHWTSSDTVAFYDVDSCGLYYAIQATGPAPGYGIGARLDTGTTTWTYSYDGEDTQTVDSCS